MTTAADVLRRSPVTPNRRHIPVFVTLGLLLLTFSIGSVRYENFGTPQVFLDLFIDNAFLIVVAIGMTFVILTGGIDLSVGSVVALSGMLCAIGTSKLQLPAPLVILFVLLVGTGFGAAMGYMITAFQVQPFITTLAGMFLARGVCLTLSENQISIENGFFDAVALNSLRLPGGNRLSWGAVTALIAVAVAIYVLQWTRLGRNVYAVGGSEQSAMLMGLPAGRTKIQVYAISGFCSALGGVLFALYTLSGDPTHAVGMELDAIAAVVIGGTVLTGGSGYLIGSVLGVLVLGVIKTILSFDGTLSSWWTRIAIGVLLFGFIALQRLIGARRKSRRSAPS
ncbi:monosaccharide ABC transporter membrane protein, CUT2 family [Thermomonospora echinospora]|uniref:Monosaccharide ABC transporter membrane protein, CUT2 family n=1 Tax=Thermomonospora echinospora TaxID=1992 RepID=A0A1H5TZG0_9ACTN|nr:galactofuranose ABC transporter, permease protein YjfF [Thermomonospora echinospora]SEF68149.1 monosaccharide ABC transporter membrane protein, CUT2 family [Thermomonospora echinospora]